MATVAKTRAGVPQKSKVKDALPELLPELQSSAFLVEMWPLEKIKEYPKNARRIPHAAIDKVALSLQEFGWRQPIVVDKDGVIVVGHCRLLAAQKLGYTYAPVHVAIDLTPAQIAAYRLMDNRSHQESEWDYDLLKPELLDLSALNLDLALTGFDIDEINRFLDPLNEVNPGSDQSSSLTENYQVLVTCPNERKQGELLESLTQDGWTCRALLS